MRALYRLLLLACPRAVRDANGAEMEALFAACLERERARRGWIGRAAAIARGAADLLIFSLDARRDLRRQARLRRTAGVNPPRRSPFVTAQHLRSTARLVRRQPLFAAGIVGMLALGIGATTAIFSVVYGVLLKPLPFPDSDRLVEVRGSRLDRGWGEVNLTEAGVWDLADMNHTFESFGGWQDVVAILTDASGPDLVPTAFVTSGFFRALGVTPIQGRLFSPAEDTPAGGGVVRPVIVSHGLWVRRYGADPLLVGKTITFGSGPRTVIGILPAGTPWLDRADVFLPMVRRADANRQGFEYSAVGRLKPGVTIPTALAQLTVVAKELERRYPATNTGLGVALEPARSWIASGALRQTLWMLLGAVGLLLVIACVNVTNLMLARAAAVARESAVRAALGASRRDLILQWVTESLVLSVLGSSLGLVLAEGLLRLMQAVSPGDIPRLAEASIDSWAFIVAASLALLIGIAIGLVPALRAPQGDIVPALRQGQRGEVGDRRASQLRNMFVGAEVALSVTLLIGAGLLVRSFVQVLSVDRGFATDHRLMATVSIPVSFPADRWTQMMTDVLDRVRAMPGVISVAAMSARPLSAGTSGLGLAAADHPEASNAAVPWGTSLSVTKDYFETMGVPLIRGRVFDGTDGTEMIGKPWRAVISQRVADLLWPGQNPIGRTIVLWKGQNDTPAEVVGVVGNMRAGGLESDPTLAVYLPGDHGNTAVLNLVVHTSVDPDLFVPALRTAVAEVDRHLPVTNPISMDRAVTVSVGSRRFTMFLLTAFAALALVLAVAGVYGVLAYSVSRRIGEIGLRLALGAEHGRLLRFVIAQGLRPVLVGLAAGLISAFVLSGLLQTLLFQVRPGDPLTYAGVAVVIACTSALACYLPARTVLRVDPATALRTE